MTNEHEMLEQAKEHERQAKELRKKAKEAKELNRLKLLAEIGEVVSEVINREIVESDVDKFRNYATDIGAAYINEALISTSPTTPAHASHEQAPPEVDVNEVDSYDSVES